MQRSRPKIWTGLVLIAMTLVVYGRACWNGFVNFDDQLYVTENPHVKAGLTRNGVRWAWETTQASNWHPLTWLSLQLDQQVYSHLGAKHRASKEKEDNVKAWGFHLTNVLLHTAAVVVLFWVLMRLTGMIWRSGFVAVLFAVHPLHVESVAWIAERKDVLSTFLGMLTLGAYALYAEQPGPGAWLPAWLRRLGCYLLVVLFFSLGLMAKPMLVTLPCVLLLLDYWPLGRFKAAQPSSPGPSIFLGRRWLAFSWLFLEKAPLFGLAAFASFKTWAAQTTTHAMQSWQDYPLRIRVGNALVACATYLGKTLWPANLAVFYPHPGSSLSWVLVAGATCLLAGISLLVWKLGRRFPYLVVGWLWFLGTLVPVLGLVQVGLQGMADRYTYLPHIGLFLMVTWVAADLAGYWRWQPLAASAAGVAIFACMVASLVQLAYWHDSVTLWQHTLDVTGDHNALAHLQLAAVLSTDKPLESIPHYRKTLQLEPDNALAHCGLGAVLMALGDDKEAENHLAQALRLKPKGSQIIYVTRLAYNNRGVALWLDRQIDAAQHHFEQALRIKPDYAPARNNLAVLLTEKGQALLTEKGQALARKSQWQKAAACLRQSIGLVPNNVQGRCYLAYALSKLGQTAAAREEYRQSLRLDPLWPQKAIRAAWNLATNPQDGARNGPLAVELAENACQATENRSPQYLDVLAAAYAEAERFDEAVATANKALAVAGQEQATEIKRRLELYKNSKPFRSAAYGTMP